LKTENYPENPSLLFFFRQQRISAPLSSHNGHLASFLTGQNGSLSHRPRQRTIKKGQALLFPEVSVDNYWCSLDLQPYETILLYHDHGTSEQFHSELKSDMDLERLPSGRFESNAIVLLLGMLAYNLLRLCGQESLREDNGNIEKMPEYRNKAQRRRIRTVMLDLIYMGGRIIHTSRRWIISFGKMNPLASLWESIYKRFVSAVTL
jgi:hypothetical protein